MTVQYHPLNFDSLQKGNIIPAEQLERITQEKLGTRKYELAILGVRQQIMQEMQIRNRPVTVVCMNGSLKILTDEEAAIYNPQHFRIGFRKLLRAHRRTLQIDQTKLGAEQRLKLERNIIIQGKMISAAKKTRRIELQPHRRSTPGLIETESQ